MASSAASNRVLSDNPNDDNIAPLESVVTEPLSESHLSAAATPESPGHLTPHSYAHELHHPPSEPKNSSNAALESQRAVLQKLKAWHQWDTDRYTSLGKFLMSKAGFPKRPICPTNTELLSLATFFFPQRHSLKVVVSDFDRNGVNREEVDINDVKHCKCPFRSWCDIPNSFSDWENKPSSALVRWMSVPSTLMRWT